MAGRKKKERKSPLQRAERPDLSVPLTKETIRQEVESRTEEEQLSEEVDIRFEMLEHDALVRDREFQKAFKATVDGTTGNRNKYTAMEKLRAALAYVVTGSSGKASEKTGIPAKTILDWKVRAKWWPQAIEYAMLAKREETDANLTQIQDLAADAVKDRLVNGNTVVDKLGMEKKVPVSAKDAMYIFGIARDKQALMRGEEAKRKHGGMTEEERLEMLATKITQAVMGKPIEGVVIKDNKDENEAG